MAHASWASFEFLKNNPMHDFKRARIIQSNQGLLMAGRKRGQKGNIQPANLASPKTATSITARNSSLDTPAEGSLVSDEPRLVGGLTLSQRISLDVKRALSQKCSTSFEYQTICEYVDEAVRSFTPRDAADAFLIKDIIILDHVATKYMQEATDMRWSHQFRHEHLKLGMKASSHKQQLIAAIDKRHGNGQQSIVVKHVRVEAGAKAMVGNFNTALSSDLRSYQNDQVSHSDLAIPTASNEQVPLGSPEKKSKLQ